MAISSSIRNPTTLSGSIISHSAQYTGTAIFTGADIIGDISRRKYVGAGIDLGSALAGVGAGEVITSAIETGFIAVGISVSAVAIPAFIGSVIAGVEIDRIATAIKYHHYGRK